MSKEMSLHTANYLAKRSDGEVTKDVGKMMVAAGGSGLALMTVAAILPFISLPMLLVLLVISGAVVWNKGENQS